MTETPTLPPGAVKPNRSDPQALLKKMGITPPKDGQPINVGDVISELMSSEVGQAFMEKSETFESDVKGALSRIYQKLDRVEQKLNLLSGHLVHSPEPPS